MPREDSLANVFLSVRAGLVRAIGGIVPPSEIEDVVQETYVRVCQSQTADDIRSPRSFMYRTARNIAINHMKKAETRLVDSLDSVYEATGRAAQEPSGDTLNLVCSREDFALFCEAVEKLPLQCRRAFVLKKVYGHTYKEIAETLQISEKTVEKHIAKGISRCRAYLQNCDKGEGRGLTSGASPSGGRQ